jgi:hypothetical protein
MGWEADWQVLGGYATQAAIYLTNELRQQTSPFLSFEGPQSFTGWRYVKSTISPRET